jgi:hypothetical protein
LSRNLGTLTSWNPLGHSRPVTGLLYFTLLVVVAVAEVVVTAVAAVVVAAVAVVVAAVAVVVAVVAVIR